MGFRLWRRVRLAPGVTLNLSQGGLGTRFGHRGCYVTVGHGHVRRTVGVPGTGMYWTSVSGSGRRQTRQVSRRAVRRAPPPSYRVPATPEQNRMAAYGCLAAIGIAITIGLAIASSGIALIPLRVCIV